MRQNYKVFQKTNSFIYSFGFTIVMKTVSGRREVFLYDGWRVMEQVIELIIEECEMRHIDSRRLYIFLLL